MTRVQFYHNTADPLALACEFVARAYRSGRNVALRLPDENTARRADLLLWSFEPLAFVPHVPADSPLAPETPVLLGHAHAEPAWSHQDILLNLATDLPPGFDAFRRVVEIVGQSEAERMPARARWTEYRRRGLTPEAFDSERREAI